MATYKILYWQEVPTQIKVDDGTDEVSVELPPRFMLRVDQLAMQRGLQGTDEFLAEWHWSDEQEREGAAAEVAQSVMAELDSLE